MDMNIHINIAKDLMKNTRTIYSSDIVYNMQEGNEGKLGVYITYKVALRNEATKLYTRVNEVINYFDERYDVDSVTNEDGEALNYQVDNYNSNGFRRVTIETNQEIEPEKQELIYITYKLQNEALCNRNSIILKLFR